MVGFLWGGARFGKRGRLLRILATIFNRFALGDGPTTGDAAKAARRFGGFLGLGFGSGRRSGFLGDFANTRSAGGCDFDGCL